MTFSLYQFLSLYFLALQSAATTEIAVLNHMDALRPDGWGAPHIIDESKVFLSGRAEYHVILYRYEIGEEQDRNGWQYLIAIRGDDITPPVQVGGGPQYFTKVTIRDHVIELSGKTYAKSDPACCPSIPITIEYILLNGRLTARGIEN